MVRREYLGYCEWILEPREVEVLQARGYAIVDGRRQPFIVIEPSFAWGVQVLIEGSDPAFGDPDFELRMLEAVAA